MFNLGSDYKIEKQEEKIENKENILFVGSPGVGKTHLATAIGLENAETYKSTYFINCNNLIEALKKAHSQ